MDIEIIHDKIRYTLSNDNLKTGDEVYPIASGRCTGGDIWILHSIEQSAYDNTEIMSCGLPGFPHIIKTTKYSDRKSEEIQTEMGFGPREKYYKIIKREHQVKEDKPFAHTEWVDIGVIVIDRSRYWWTPEQKGLTEQDITDKLEELWINEKARATRDCPDCGVAPGKDHNHNCDVARCGTCKMQALSCGCDDVGTDVWDGTWPGTKECYELRLLTWSDPNRVGGTGWAFNLNSLAEAQAKINQLQK